MPTTLATPYKPGMPLTQVIQQTIGRPDSGFFIEFIRFNADTGHVTGRNHIGDYETQHDALIDLGITQAILADTFNAGAAAAPRPEANTDRPVVVNDHWVMAYWYACGYNDHRVGALYVDPQAFAEHWKVLADRPSRPSMQDAFDAFACEQ